MHERSHNLPAEVRLQPSSPFGLVVQADQGNAKLDDLPPEFLLEAARENRILVLHGFVPFEHPEQLVAFGQSLGQVPVAKFGLILDLVEQESPADGVFGSNWLPYHWDGMFFDRIPEFQVFQCISAPDEDQGGRTLFCDTTLALADADPDTRARWAATTVEYSIDNKSHYGGSVRSPLVVPHPDRGFPTIRYHEPVPEDMAYPNPITVRGEDLSADEFAEVARSIRESIYDPRHVLAHRWRTGDFVIADNYSMLHAREAFTTRASRHLRRVHVLGDPPFTNPALPRA